MVKIELTSLMRDWEPGDYPASPFIRVLARDDKSDQTLESDLATEAEVEHSFNRIGFEFKVLPGMLEPERLKAKIELALQRRRIRKSG